MEPVFNGRVGLRAFPPTWMAVADGKGAAWVQDDRPFLNSYAALRGKRTTIDVLGCREPPGAAGEKPPFLSLLATASCCLKLSRLPFQIGFVIFLALHGDNRSGT